MAASVISHGLGFLTTMITEAQKTHAARSSFWPNNLS